MSRSTPSPRELLLFRVNTGERVGRGHLMRCVTLAEAWRRQGGDAHFATVGSVAGQNERLQAIGVTHSLVGAEPGSPADLAETVDLARREGARWVVVDGYVFGADFRRGLQESGIQVLWIDDSGYDGACHAQLVLNQNLHAGPHLYPDCGSDTQLLLGTRYLLLRREFQQADDRVREIPDVARKVLVTLGGGDPGTAVVDIVEALRLVDIPDLQVLFVIGDSGSYKPRMEACLKNAPQGFRVEYEVREMWSKMAWADVAVSAGGTTCWELAYLGVPMAVVARAPNQEGIATSLQESGAAIHLGIPGNLSRSELVRALGELLTDRDLRERMSQRGKTLVTGSGASDVVRAIRSHSKKNAERT